MALITEDTEPGRPRAAVRPADRRHRRARPRVARRARALLRHAVEGGARQHPRRAREVPRHPGLLARRLRRQLPGEVPDRPRGRAHGLGPASRCAPSSTSSTSTSRSSSPTTCSSCRCSRRPTTRRRSRAPTTRGSSTSGPRVEKGLLGCIIACPHDPQDAAREIEKYADHPEIVGVYLPCAGLDPLWGHRMYDPIWEAARGRRPAGAAAQRDRHPPGLPVQQPRLRHRAGPPRLQPHVLDHGQHRAHDHDRRRGALSEAAHRASPRRASRGCRSSCNRLDKEYLERRRDVPFLDGAPEPLPQAVLRRDAADRGARGHARRREDDRALRRLGHARCSRPTGRTTTSTTR